MRVVSLILALAIAAAGHADWSQWRGPGFDGSAEAHGLPVAWSATENIAWTTELPGPSAATPSVTGDRIFLSSLDPQTLDVLALGLDRATGVVLWQRVVGKGRLGPRAGFENTRAECSPVSNDELACFLFGDGAFAAFDHAGTPLWERNLVDEFGPFNIQWGYGSSPLLMDDMIVVQVLQSGESYLLAVDAATGTTRWRHVRADQAIGESEQAYTSPIPFQNGERREILVLGADAITAHDPATGVELWRWRGLNPNGRGNFRSIANTVTGPPGWIYVTTPRGTALHGLRVRGNVVEEVWSTRRGAPDVCTPLFYDDKLYVVDGRRRRRIACLAPTTGDVLWEGELPTPTYIRSSPTAGDGKIYVMDAEGHVCVIAADEFRVLGESEMNAYPSRASIAIDDDQLLIRTADALTCVGRGRPAAAAEPSVARIASEPSASWPSFRGEHARGVADGRPLPTRWNVETGEHVAWRTPIPGLAHSSPVVRGNDVFVTSAVKDVDEAELKVGLYGSIQPVDEDVVHRFQVHRLDASSGAIRWSRTAHEGVPAVKRHPKSSHATCTPATNGTHVVAFFGSEGLYCYDMDGTLLWQRDFGVLDAGFYMVPDAQWGFGSSPVIHDDLVIVQCDVQKGSFIAALRLSDGSDVWRTPRNDVPTWSTPTVDIRAGRSQVIVNGYRHIGGYDLRTGAELWSLVGGGDIPVPTPIVAHDLIFITNAHGKMAPVYAIDPLASGRLSTDSRDEVHWMVERRGNYMQTPIVYGPHLYCCNDAGILTCYEATTGTVEYRERLGSGRTGFSASIVAGDGKLYATSEEGDVHVIKAGPSFEVLAVNAMNETCMATPSIAGGTLYFRTRSHVVAIKEPGGER